MNFQTQHLGLLAKYAGISFIAGAVNHGFFSEERSFITAGAGVVFFLIGGWLEMRMSPDGTKRWADLLGFGIVASIGLGFFTGGLQHFPDSPSRSMWVVPLGFFLSLVALYFTEGKGRIAPRALAAYAGMAGFAVVAGSLLAASWLQAGGSGAGVQEAAHDGHSHTHSTAEAPAAPIPAAAQGPGAGVRNVVIELDDTMRFNPSNWQASEGEQLRIVVVNKGKLRHELVLGQAQELAEHAAEMKNSPAHHHHQQANAASAGPGETVSMLWTFDKAGEWGMACFEPGHYEAGMKGSVQVGKAKV